MKFNFFLVAVTLCASDSLAAKLSGATTEVDAGNANVDDLQGYNEWWCDNGSGSKNCRWRGAGPFCGEPGRGYNIGDTINNHGDVIDGMILTDWTKNSPVWKLYDMGDITKDCRRNYGQGCSFGYKILVCKP